MKITVIEPSWNGLAHCPANLGALRILQHAYPQAKIHFVAGQRHFDEIRKISPEQFISRIAHIPYDPELDKDTLPSQGIKTLLKLKRIPPHLLREADFIVLTSCTASSLTAFDWLGLSRRIITFLHGNANELSGWRSKNPVRRMFDFVSALKRFTRRGGKVLVYEHQIQKNLINTSPWLDRKIFTLGHPLIEEEATFANPDKKMGTPIRIAFVGNATISKGFPEFVKIAQSVNVKRPGIYEFHSFGNLHTGCKDIDQSPLVSPAGISFPRDKFIQKIARMDFIFAWHSGDYYNNAASGIVYDAINLGIPLIARKTAFLQDQANQGTPIAMVYDHIEEVIEMLATETPCADIYEKLISAITAARTKNSTAKLANDLMLIMNEEMHSYSTHT